MRITIIAEDLRPPIDEGMKKTSLNLIHSFVNKGVEVSTFTRYATCLPAYTLGLPSNRLFLGKNFYRAMRIKSPALILYIPSSSGTVGAFSRAAVLKTLSGGIPLGLVNLQSRKLPGFVRYLRFRNFVNVVFTQSRASAIALASLGFNTTLLPGGVDTTIFRPVDEDTKCKLRTKYGFPVSSRIVLHVGHVKQGRNVSMLAGLAAKGYQAVMVAGASAGTDQVLLADLRRSGVTVITGFVERVQELYQLADCYLFPVLDATSAIDAPLSVLEAMACNLPVVTTRFGALLSMFQSGHGFYFFDPKEDITSLVERACENRDCMTSRIVSNYSWDNLASTILNSFEKDICR